MTLTFQDVQKWKHNKRRFELMGLELLFEVRNSNRLLWYTGSQPEVYFTWQKGRPSAKQTRLLTGFPLGVISRKFEIFDRVRIMDVLKELPDLLRLKKRKNHDAKSNNWVGGALACFLKVSFMRNATLAAGLFDENSLEYPFHRREERWDETVDP